MNLLLIVGDASAAALRPVAPAIAAWVKTGQPAPLIFSESEWLASADVFPIEIEDMREAHRLLGGRDPFESVRTERSDLRQELEREIRSKLLRLRTEYAAAAPSGKALGELLENSAGTFFVLFRAVARVVGKVPPAEPAALVAEVAAAAGMDPAAFDWVLGRLAGRKVPALAPYDPAGGRYMDAIERLARFVDQMGLAGQGTNG
ncbi:MAG: hypothetical protein HY705_01730 [Gemmatimonadetes bacterium]|nr:hypothetical protein [Gemmatimonadota bacterium]